MVAATCLWATLAPTVKALLARGVSPLEIAWWRAAGAGGLFLLQAALAGARGGPGLRLASGRDAALLLAFALVGVTVFYAALPLAIEAGGVSLATVLLYTAPVFVALLAGPLLGEWPDGRRLALVGLAVAGVVVLVVGAGAGAGVVVTPASVGLGLASGASYASYYLFGKWILGRYPAATVFAWAMPAGALGLLPFALGGAGFAAKDTAGWGLLALAVGAGTYLPYLCYAGGLRRLEAARAALLATLEPVVTVALAMALFGERLGGVGLLGGALVLGAAAAAAVGPGRGGR